MPTYSLTGEGIQPLTEGTTEVIVTILNVPSGSSFGSANPTNRYGVGLLRFGNDAGFDEPFPILGGPQRIVLEAPSSQMGYRIFGDGIVNVTESAGLAPVVFSTLDGTTSFPGAAITVRWNNPAALAEDWITLSLVSDTSDVATRYLGADGWMRCNSCSTTSTLVPRPLGSCVTFIDDAIPGGTYNVKLWHDGPSVLLATGAPITIG